ncbi:hypothetical protein [Cupriavidus nantongensis]|uniref:hypothetical protein n=1 Tax=Cupriavidus nantongensis TaxID=1796606 RepID=UPI0012B694FB|nr:hypothetical protein [Cupriavidus nantongensis]
MSSLFKYFDLDQIAPESPEPARHRYVAMQRQKERARKRALSFRTKRIEDQSRHLP